MATMRMTVGSLFGVINTTAVAATQVVGVIGKGAGMLDAAVTDAAETQQERLAFEAESRTDRLVMDAAQQEAERNVSAEQFCNRSEAHARYYLTAQAKYQAVATRLKAAKVS
jgi:hypothetical protein